MNKKDYESDDVQIKAVHWASVIGVVLGAVVANLLKWGIPSINGMVVAIICYLIGYALRCKK
jgi:cytosine permease